MPGARLPSRLTAARAFVLIAKYCMSHVQNSPEVSFPCVHLRRTGVYATNHRIIRGALSSVNLCTDAFVSGVDTGPHEHIRHTCWYTTTCIVYIYVKYRIEIMRYIAWSVLRYPENVLDIDTDLCRKYRMSMSRILDTIPNTRYRTHKFLKHRCFLYASAYCMTYLVRFILLVSPGIRLNT